MVEYRYVMVASDGRSWLLQGDEQYGHSSDNNAVLPPLLCDGWRPVRERALPGPDGGLALVLVKKWPAGGDEDIPF